MLSAHQDTKLNGRKRNYQGATGGIAEIAKFEENENGGKTLERRGQRPQGVFKCSEHTRTQSKTAEKETIKKPLVAWWK